MHDFRLADEFFLINHDELTGKPSISREFVGAGVVAALLGELVLDGRVTMHDQRVTVLDSTPVGDAPSDLVAETLANQRKTHPVRTWTANLDEIAYEIVARRLIERGTVQRHRAKRLIGPRRDMFRSARREAVIPLTTLEAVLRNPAQADDQRALCAALVNVAGPGRVLAPELERRKVQAVIKMLTNGLPTHLTELLTGFEAAVDDLAVRIRR